jgi:hypothetical protein
MIRNELCCPHGEPLIIRTENGMVVYRHASGGEY